MSLTPKGEELPKKGEELPSARERQEQAQAFALPIAAALKEELARGASIKTIMAWTGAGERTVKGWLTVFNAPPGVAPGRPSAVVRGGLRADDGPEPARLPIANRQSLEVLHGQLIGLIDAIGTALA